ncbi:MAG TPA: (2Fe-2S)-binding protein [Candidatus Limnocylindria bacterium]|nr:(2Fe-2S)-binding protein [Candidatus Limnocylindria bacterium]
MILCLCQGVSEREVAEAVARGASTLSEVRRACGAGGDCGACVAHIRAQIEAARGCSRAA